MIQECENMLPNFLVQRYKDKWFPNYLVIRRPQDSENIAEEENQWQGFVKQIKRHFEKENQSLKIELLTQK